MGDDEMVGDDIQKNVMVWPTIAETKGYRQQVIDKISEPLRRIALSLKVTRTMAAKSPSPSEKWPLIRSVMYL